MIFWLILFTSETWALMLLFQAFQTEDKQRLAWLKQRVLLCAWLAFSGAAGVIAILAYGVYSAHHSRGGNVSGLMKGILFALVLLLLPLLARSVVNRRAQRLGA